MILAVKKIKVSCNFTYFWQSKLTSEFQENDRKHTIRNCKNK